MQSARAPACCHAAAADRGSAGHCSWCWPWAGNYRPASSSPPGTPCRCTSRSSAPCRSTRSSSPWTSRSSSRWTMSYCHLTQRALNFRLISLRFSNDFELVRIDLSQTFRRQFAARAPRLFVRFRIALPVKSPGRRATRDENGISMLEKFSVESFVRESELSVVRLFTCRVT